jgi:hypothetical protein
VLIKDDITTAMEDQRRRGEEEVVRKAVLEFLNNLWGLGTEKNRVV